MVSPPPISETSQIWAKLEALGETESQFKKGSTSALYLEHILLLPDHLKDYHAKEWFVIEGHTAELQKLCEKLDAEKPYDPRGKGFENFEVTLESEDGTTETANKEVNTYKNEDTCIAAFKDYAPNVVQEQTGSWLLFIPKLISLGAVTAWWSSETGHPAKHQLEISTYSQQSTNFDI